MMFTKHKHEQSEKKCLKCRYDELFKEGKIIFNDWNKEKPIPPRLVFIRKELIKLKTAIENHKNDEELKFCADHAELFDFLPVEIL